MGDIAELSASSESHRLERASVATPLAQPGGAASCDAGVVLGSRIITRRRADMSLLGDSSDDYGGSDSMDEDYDTDTDEEEDDDADTTQTRSCPIAPTSTQTPQTLRAPAQTRVRKTPERGR